MLDLLHQFLFFNPSQRLKAADALQHAYFSETEIVSPPSPPQQATTLPNNSNDLLLTTPPCIGKRRQHSTENDEPKLRKTEDGSPYYITTDLMDIEEHRAGDVDEDIVLEDDPSPLLNAGGER